MAINSFYKFIIIMTLFWLSGCSQKIDRSNLIGKYFANHGKAIDTIELKSDGTYVYYYNSNDGNSLSYINRWTFDYENKEPRITFEKFIFGLPGYSIRGPGYWDVEVEENWGKVRLCIDADLNYYYEKIIKKETGKETGRNRDTLTFTGVFFKDLMCPGFSLRVFSLVILLTVAIKGSHLFNTLNDRITFQKVKYTQTSIRAQRHMIKIRFQVS